jgi:hypothetical protein
MSHCEIWGFFTQKFHRSDESARQRMVFAQFKMQDLFACHGGGRTNGLERCSSWHTQ